MQAISAAPPTVDLVHDRGPFSNLEEASAAARRIMKDMALEGPCSALEVIGRFVVPPLEVPQRRDFQTMHFDFGLPLGLGRPVDLARCTALYMPAELAPSAALTRFVMLDALLDQRRWAPREVLLARFVAYGASHGAWEHTVARGTRTTSRRGDVPALSRRAAGAARGDRMS